MPCALLLLLLSLGHDLAAKKEKNRMRDENKKAFYWNPGKSSYPLPKKKNFGRPPRELKCSDRAQTSTTGSGRPSCIEIVLGFWLKVLVRRDKFENRRKNHNYTYTYTVCIQYTLCGDKLGGRVNTWRIQQGDYAMPCHLTGTKSTTYAGQPTRYCSARENEKGIKKEWN